MAPGTHNRAGICFGVKWHTDASAHTWANNCFRPVIKCCKLNLHSLSTFRHALLFFLLHGAADVTFWKSPQNKTTNWCTLMTISCTPMTTWCARTVHARKIVPASHTSLYQWSKLALNSLFKCLSAKNGSLRCQDVLVNRPEPKIRFPSVMELFFDWPAKEPQLLRAHKQPHCTHFFRAHDFLLWIFSHILYGALTPGEEFVVLIFATNDMMRAGFLWWDAY